MLSRRSALLVFLIFFVAIVGCSRAPSASAASANQQDEYRFAVMSPAIAVMLRDLGFEDQIVGKHSWDMVLGDSVPIVGSEIGVDYEAMIHADPTHVFYQRTSAGVPSRLRALADKHGWTVHTMPLDTLDDIANGLDDLYIKFVGVREKSQTEIDPTVRFQEMSMPSSALAAAWDDLGPIADRCGRVLVLGAVEPPGAMGPRSFHAQLIERLGANPAITEGSMWIELDFEDIVVLNPDAILLFSPRVTTEADRFASNETEADPLAHARMMLGKIAELDINAVRNNRLAVIGNPLGLLPSSSFAKVGRQVAEVLKRWGQESPEPEG